MGCNTPLLSREGEGAVFMFQSGHDGARPLPAAFCWWSSDLPASQSGQPARAENQTTTVNQLMPKGKKNSWPKAEPAFGDLLSDQPHVGSESQAKGRVLCVEAELLPTRTAAGLTGCPFSPPLASPWCSWGATASWSSQPVCLKTNWGVCY